MILAGIDIGTNTLRLLIAETGLNSFHAIYSDRRITRLGQDLDRTGNLSPDAEERSLSALHDFIEQIRRYRPVQVSAIGTSALRKASNASAFIREVKARTGLEVTVISGEEEARLTLRGVTGAVATEGRRGKTDLLKGALVIDIGGGSTEIIVTGSRQAPVSVSLPLGAVYLTERFISHDPATRDELGSLRRYIDDVLAARSDMIDPKTSCLCIGTAGTITTLAAIDQGLAVYDPERIHRSVLTRDALNDMVTTLSAMTVADRRSIRGLETGREDIILAGAIVAQAIMERYRYTSMLVSDWGLREGIVLDLYEQRVREHGPRPPQD